MRQFSLSRIRFGLPYMFLGSFFTFAFMSLSYKWHENHNQPNNNDEPWPVNLAQRNLRNLRSPSYDDKQQIHGRDEIMKLMSVLMKKLNKTINIHKETGKFDGIHYEDPVEEKHANIESELQEPVNKIQLNSDEKQAPQLRDWIPDTKQPKVWPSDDASHFKIAMDVNAKKTVYDTLLTLEQISQKHGFTWMLYSGTLLGSWRHHDIIPWDDDFDILMNYTQREKVKAILSNMAPKYEFFEAGSRMKFWASNGTVKASEYPWKWPYLDISFFKENATHIWDGSMEDDYGDRLYMYHKKIVFPLHLRPMGKYYFPAPRDSFAHLLATYRAGGMGMCWTAHYSHKSETLKDKVYKIMCHELVELYPFVHRSISDDNITLKETLIVNRREIHSVIVKEPTYAITDPYAISLQ